MYARQTPDNRFPRNVRIPQNYSGNTFRQSAEKAEVSREGQDMPQIAENEYISPIAEQTNPEKDTNEALAEDSSESTPTLGKANLSPGFKLDLGNLFKGKNGFGIGIEELLIIGLIFLIAQNDSNDDLLFLLFLLLFIK